MSEALALPSIDELIAEKVFGWKKYHTTSMENTKIWYWSTNRNFMPSPVPEVIDQEKEILVNYTPPFSTNLTEAWKVIMFFRTRSVISYEKMADAVDRCGLSTLTEQEAATRICKIAFSVLGYSFWI